MSTTKAPFILFSQSGSLKKQRAIMSVNRWIMIIKGIRRQSNWVLWIQAKGKQSSYSCLYLIGGNQQQRRVLNFTFYLLLSQKHVCLFGLFWTNMPFSLNVHHYLIHESSIPSIIPNHISACSTTLHMYWNTSLEIST